MEAFTNYLSTRGHIKEKYVPYYLKWVNDCARYFDVSMKDQFSVEEIEEFVNYLGKKNEENSICMSNCLFMTLLFFLCHSQILKC